MKFSASQIEFLMTKMTISDIDQFNAEASSFVPSKPKRTRVAKEAGEKVICSAVTKKGEACKNAVKRDGLCNRHCPKPAEEAPVNSDSEVEITSE
jgi:hypothetical protein